MSKYLQPPRFILVSSRNYSSPVNIYRRPGRSSRNTEENKVRKAQESRANDSCVHLGQSLALGYRFPLKGVGHVLFSSSWLGKA